MTDTSLAIRGAAQIGAPLTIPPAVRGCLFDQRGGGWDATRALSEAKRDGVADSIPALARQMADALAPMDGVRLRQKLTLMGAAMSPNRSREDGAAWLAHMSAGLRDLPEDILLGVIDEWVRSSRFLPQVADIRERAEPLLEKRNREAARLDCMARLIASGQDVPAAPPVRRWEAPEPFREEDRCTPEQAEAIRAELGISFAAGETAKRHLGRPRMPTAADYADLGVAPENIPTRRAA